MERRQSPCAQERSRNISLRFLEAPKAVLFQAIENLVIMRLKMEIL